MARNSVAKDVADYIKNSSLQNLPPVFHVEWGKDSNGQEIENQVLIEEGEAAKSIVGDSYEQPVVQMTVRGGTEQTSDEVWDYAVAIDDFVIQSSRVTINNQSYALFEPLSSLQSLGRDEAGRHMVINRYFTYRDL